MVDLFFHHGAVDIVCAKSLRDLRDARRQHDPIRFDVIEVVEHQPRHRDVSQIEVAARSRNVRQRRVVRMKRQRNEGHESVRLVLQFAQLHEVIDALFFGLDVAVEHRRVGVQSSSGASCALCSATSVRSSCDRK